MKYKTIIILISSSNIEMTNNEDNSKLEDSAPLNSKNLEKKRITWKFCPVCGSKLPDIERLKYCIICGVDLQYIKEYNKVPPSQTGYQYGQAAVQPTYQYGQAVVQPTYQDYKPYKEVLSDEEVLYTKEKRLWGNWPSIGFPLLGFLLTNGILLGILILLLIIGFFSLVFNPFFLVLAILATYILFLIPVWYVKKYLQNPNLSNRLIILGFTRKGFDQKRLLKEIFIGIGFAFVSFFLAVLSSVGIELILRYVFGVTILREAPSGNADAIVTGIDVFILILLIIMMIVVVGPSEEIMFRGFMQRGLVRTLGEKWGIVITALIFASLHLVGLIIYISDPFIFLILFIYMLVPLFAVSLMWGFLFRWRKENLIAVVVTHGVYNSLILIILFLYYLYY